MSSKQQAASSKQQAASSKHIINIPISACATFAPFNSRLKILFPTLFFFPTQFVKL
jgi:hypothetical protein